MRLLPAIAVTAACLLPSLAAAQSFRTPSGNITCVVEPPPQGAARGGEYAIRCDIAQTSAARPQRPRDCTLDWGHAFGLFNTGPAMRYCVGNSVIDTRAPVLDYGQSTAIQAIICRSERAGLTCTNREGRGFFLSRARQQVF